MIFDAKGVDVFLVLVLVCSVLCYPEGNNGKPKRNLGTKVKHAGGTRSGKDQEVGHGKIVNLKDNNTETTKQRKIRRNDNQQLASSDYKENQQLAGSEYDSSQQLESSEGDNQQLADSDSDNNQLLESNESYDQQPFTDDELDEPAIVASIEIDDDSIVGSVDVPSEFDALGLSDTKKNKKECWMKLKNTKHFQTLDELEASFASARNKYQKEVGTQFDQWMLDVRPDAIVINAFIKTNGAAARAIHQAYGATHRIPAGLNLGGHCMMRMKNSVLFFHRLKLRNSTNFQVNYLQNNLVDMTLIARLNLNDLHLAGAYQRSTTHNDPSVLFYVPNFGEIEVLLKDATYKMEGRLRMLHNRLLIELVNSELSIQDAMMNYKNRNITEPLRLMEFNIEEFTERLKCDLDTWLKDYFNDYLMYQGPIGPNNVAVQAYEKKKTAVVNELADNIIDSIKERLAEYGATDVKLPEFTFFSLLNSNIKLHNGILRGLGTIYRRSVATTKKSGNVRYVDATVAFSMLKVEYLYEAVITPELPPLKGTVILSADELTAHMGVAAVEEPQTVDLNFDSLIPIKSESLTVEGPANRVIANFKELLEHTIVAILTSTLRHNIRMMKSLTRCKPFLHGNEKRNPQSHYRPYYYDDEGNNIDDASFETSDDDDIPHEQYQYSDGNGDLVSDEDSAYNPDVDANRVKASLLADGPDYVFYKNDSVEIQFPKDGTGEMQNMEII